MLYRIDDQDDIVFVDEEWDRFARANAGENVTSCQVLQRSLWDFIVDSTTRELYRQILKRVREGHSIRFKFRCDSPTYRRLLQMEVCQAVPGTVEFLTSTLSETHRGPPVFLTGGASLPDELLRVCGWCKKVLVGGSWVEVEQAVEHLQVFERSSVPLTTHGICEPCHEKMTEILTDL